MNPRIQSLDEFNIMEFWPFDTCNFRCGYCGLVPTGAVRRTDQLAPFRDPEYIEQLLTFFRDNRPSGRPWAVLNCGGEPLLMPNLDMFTIELGRMGDMMGIYTNMSLPILKVLSREAIQHICYIEASFHPDWHMGDFDEEQFFANVAEAKGLSIPILVRFVGAPQVLDMLPRLEERCKQIGVTFMPTTLFSPEYPSSYTSEERARLASHMVGYSSLIQLDGGIDARKNKCFAADRLFAVRLHQGGDITPCMSTGTPVIGNIYENRLEPIAGPSPCFKPDGLCTCDIHFQQHVVEGVDDRQNFVKILEGKGQKMAEHYDAWKQRNNVHTTDKIYAGQGLTVLNDSDLVKQAPLPLPRSA